MTPKQLATVGQALYGERWQTALAIALGITDRNMRRWVKGTHAIPDKVRADLAIIVERHGRKLEKILAGLQDVGA